MEKVRFQAYIASLGQIVKSTHFDLRETMNEFQDMCSRVTSERIVPSGMITDIRQTYKEIQDQLTKIRGIHQLLESKYRGHYRRDSDREREIMEFTFLAKSLYSKFEYTLQEIEAKRKLRDGGEDVVAYRRRLPSPWFHSEENQIILLRNLRDLHELDYKTWADSEFAQRRRIIWDRPRSVSLFTLSGEATLIDNFQSRMHLREYDIKERLTAEELRGALTHLREISLSEVETVLRRFTGASEFSKLRCLLFTVQSQEDLEKEILGSARNMLHRHPQSFLRSSC
ncbi:MAG: hypothetical protein ACXU9X_12035 [Thermodesulfobacteriota bacterium]